MGNRSESQSKRRSCTEFIVEPPSQEDIRVTLKTDGTLTGGPIELQAKERGAEPLGVQDFVETVQGSSARPGKRGPKRRKRPLSMLQEDPTLRYIVVTDAQPDRKLKDFRIKKSINSLPPKRFQAWRQRSPLSAASASSSAGL